MQTIYKNIKINNDNELYINKKFILKLDITNQIFKHNVIASFKKQLLLFNSDKTKLNNILESDFIISSNNNTATISNNRYSLFVSSFKDGINAIYN